MSDVAHWTDQILATHKTFSLAVLESLTRLLPKPNKSAKQTENVCALKSNW